MKDRKFIKVRFACKDFVEKNDHLLTVQQKLILRWIASHQEHKFLNNLTKRDIKNLALFIDYLPLEMHSRAKTDYIDFLAEKCPQALYEYCLKKEKENNLVGVRKLHTDSHISSRLDMELLKPQLAKGLLDYYCAKNAQLNQKGLGLKINPRTLPEPVRKEYLYKKETVLKHFPTAYQFIKTAILTVFGYGNVYRMICGGDEQLAQILKSCTSTYGTLSATFSPARSPVQPNPVKGDAQPASVYTPDVLNKHGDYTPDQLPGGQRANTRIVIPLPPSSPSPASP